jgi:hypothetical protein
MATGTGHAEAAKRQKKRWQACFSIELQVVLDSG